MPGWQDKVVAVLLAEPSDLRALARLAGYDPATFWRDANIHNAGLSAQDLTGLDLSCARMPPGVARSDTMQDAAQGEAPDLAEDLKAWADAKLASGNRWLERAMDDWRQAEAHLDRAAAEMQDAVDGLVDAGARRRMALTRKRLAEVLLLLSDAAPQRAMKAVDEGEDALRIARSAMEGDGHKGGWELGHDAGG